MAKDTDVRTYNVRDPQGNLDFSTDDLGELFEHLDKRSDKFILDDFDLKDLRKLAKAQERDERAARKQAVQEGKQRHQAIQARAKELGDPATLAEAVATLEHDLGKLNDE